MATTNLIVFGILMLVQTYSILSIEGDTDNSKLLGPNDFQGLKNVADSAADFMLAKQADAFENFVPAEGAVLVDWGTTSNWTNETTQQPPGTNYASDGTTEMTTEFDDTTIANAPSGKNLPLILGLTLGLGVPATLGVIGSAAYYLKVYRPKHRVAV